jgi:hypothetical protein
MWEIKFREPLRITEMLAKPRETNVNTTSD